MAAHFAARETPFYPCVLNPRRSRAGPALALLLRSCPTRCGINKRIFRAAPAEDQHIHARASPAPAPGRGFWASRRAQVSAALIRHLQNSKPLPPEATHATTRIRENTQKNFLQSKEFAKLPLSQTKHERCACCETFHPASPAAGVWPHDERG